MHSINFSANSSLIYPEITNNSNFNSPFSLINKFIHIHQHKIFLICHKDLILSYRNYSDITSNEILYINELYRLICVSDVIGKYKIDDINDIICMHLYEDICNHVIDSTTVTNNYSVDVIATFIKTLIKLTQDLYVE